MDKKARITLDDFTGGMNAYDPSWALAANECADAVNMDFFRSRCGTKRPGTFDVTSVLSGTTFTGVLSSFFRHVPGTDPTAAELWGVDDAATPIINRLVNVTTWSAPTLKDAPTGNGWEFSAASANGLLALAYKSAVNRLHFWDGATVRRGGIAATGAAPTVANTGAGAYAAVLRYYRQRSATGNGVVIVRRSEPSAIVSFTPSGGGTAARITQATPVNEGETHWEVEASTDGVTFYRIATVAIATTTYDDSAATTSYQTNPLSAPTGTYTLQKPYKYVAMDQGRLIGFGSWNTADKQNDLEFSAVVGSLDVSDLERVDTTTNYRLGLDENDSGVPTGLKGPVHGQFFAFKDYQIWRLTPTGNVALPYRADAVSKTVGAVENTAIDIGSDQNGDPCIYFMSRRGPFRCVIAPDGTARLEYIGRNVEPYVMGPTLTMNLNATKRKAVTCHYHDRRQVLFWYATESSNDPNAILLYDTVKGAWSRVPTTEIIAGVRCAVVFPQLLVSVAASRAERPWIGLTSAPHNYLVYDYGTYSGQRATDPGLTTYQSTITTRDIEVGGPGMNGEVGDAELMIGRPDGTGNPSTLTVTTVGDFAAVSDPTMTKTVTIATLTAGARAFARAEESGLSGIRYAHWVVADSSSTSAWTLDTLVIPVTHHEALSR